MQKPNITTMAKDLAELYRKANAGDEEAVQQLLLLNVEYVVSLTKQYYRPGVTAEELIMAGMNGLKQYFKTHKNDEYLIWHIKQSILMELKERNLLPEPIKVSRIS
jgi:DNA-directed RNA polymerase sigma subunit (sigma70/sigma32)